jgi:branched-chain amino acid transport system substrate-binding protein
MTQHQTGAGKGGARRASILGVALAAIGLISAACNLGGTSITAPPDALGTVTIGANDPIHLAFWGVLSGADASLGTDGQRGVELAIADLTDGKLLGHTVSLSSEDALCTPAGGATAATKLAADKTIVALVGSTCSDETVGGIATLTAAGMTTISPSNTRPALTDPTRDATYAGYLRTAHSDAFQGKAVAEFVKNELGKTTIATIHDGSAYAQALQQVAADNFTQLGGTVTSQQAVQKDQTNMQDVLNTIATSNAGGPPDVLYYPIFTAAGGYITAQVRDVPGMENVILIGSDGLFSADFVAAAGPNAEGMYLSSPDFSKFPAGYKSFVDKYKAKYGENPIQIFHAHAYDAANIIFKAIEKVAVKAGDTIYVGRQALRDAIYATKDFPGITGTLTCGQYGDCGAPVIAVYQITAREVGGQWPPEAPIWPK